VKSDIFWPLQALPTASGTGTCCRKAYLQEEIKLEYNYENIIGQSDGLNYVLYKVEQIASSDTTVLILGETGTGKELVARAIHGLSPRKGRVLVKVNCATLPSNLIESELFGHEKGAFTGAYARHLDDLKLPTAPRFFWMRAGNCRSDQSLFKKIILNIELLG
jgi:chemotaxis protein methyltransferase CheR